MTNVDTYEWYFGNLSNDEKDGFGISFYFDWDLVTYVGNYKNGKMHGQGQHVYKNGSTYNGDYYETEGSGEGIINQANGTKSMFMFENGIGIKMEDID